METNFFVRTRSRPNNSLQDCLGRRAGLPSSRASYVLWVRRGLRVVLVICLLVMGCGKGEPPAAEEEHNLPSEAVPVEAVKIESSVLRPALDLVGSLVAAPERIAVVSPQLGGWVETVHVVDGQLVRAGEKLIAFDSRVARVELARARAAVKEKQAVVARLKRGFLPHELEVARQDRDKAGAAMEGLQGEMEAMQQLRSRNEVSKVHFETKVKAYKAAEAAFASADAHVKLLEEGTRPEMIDEAEAQLDNVKASLDHAKLALEFCTITSPINGIVVQLVARQGQYFNQASPLATVLDLSEIFVHLRVPAAEFANVREGTSVDVVLSSLPSRTYSGKIVRVGGEADPLTGNIDVFASLTNEKTMLRPGMGCRAHVWLPEIPDVLAVPVSAIADHAGKSIISVVRDDKAYEIEVELGAQTAELVQIVKGISSGDIVITAGGYGLPEGCPVRIVSDLASAKTAGL